MGAVGDSLADYVPVAVHSAPDSGPAGTQEETPVNAVGVAMYGLGERAESVLGGSRFVGVRERMTVL
jgi:hypothetical protein